MLATAGVRYLIVLIGINDIGYSSGTNPISAAANLIAGYRQLIARAHAEGIAIFGATLPPFEGFVLLHAGEGSRAAGGERLAAHRRRIRRR